MTTAGAGTGANDLRTMTLYTDSARTVAVGSGTATIVDGATGTIYVANATSGLLGQFTITAPTDNQQDSDAGNTIVYQYQNTLTFSSPVAGAISIIVQRKSSTETLYSNITTLTVDTTSFIDTIVDDPGKTYDYRIIVNTLSDVYVTNVQTQVPFAQYERAFSNAAGTLDSTGNIYITMGQASNGISKSTDGGRTFTQVKQGGGVVSLQISPNDASMYAGWASYMTNKNSITVVASPFTAIPAKVKNIAGTDLALRNLGGAGTATAGGASTLTDSNQNFTVNVLTNYKLMITGGTGSGEEKTIVSNTATVITISGTWTANPDNTSTYEVRLYDSIWYPSWGIDWDDDGKVWVGVSTQLNVTPLAADRANNYVYYSDITGNNFTEIPAFPNGTNYFRHIHTVKFNTVSKLIFVTVGDGVKQAYSMDKNAGNITLLSSLLNGATGWSQVSDGILWANDDPTGAHIVKTDHYGNNATVVFTLPAVYTASQCWGLHTFGDGEIWSIWYHATLGRITYVSIDGGTNWALYMVNPAVISGNIVASPTAVHGNLIGSYVTMLPSSNKPMLFLNKIK